MTLNEFYLCNLVYNVFNLTRESKRREDARSNIKCKEESHGGDNTSERETKETQECNSHFKR